MSKIQIGNIWVYVPDGVLLANSDSGLFFQNFFMILSPKQKYAMALDIFSQIGGVTTKSMKKDNLWRLM